MKTKFNVLLTAGLFSFSLIGYAQTKDNNTKTNDANHKHDVNDKDQKHDMVLVEKVDKDYKFVVDAAEASLLEVQLGELAQANGSSSLVKEYGKTMVNDHKHMLTELTAVAEKKKFIVPTKLGDKLRKKYTDLAGKKGAEFDKDYIDLMVKNHKDLIDSYEDEAEDGKDADIKSWAQSRISSLKHHLQMAESTKNVGKK